MQVSKKIQIFISYHKNYHIFKNEILTPIHVGSALSNNKLDMVSDSTGDNISEKNPNFCELTAQYWAWKNCNDDYIGFLHYRRLFDFTEKNLTENKWGLVVEDNIDNIYLKYGLNTDFLNHFIPQYDVIISKPWDVSNAGTKNLHDHYNSAESKLHIKDYDRALEILVTKYPQYQQAINKYNNSKLGYFNNMFILKRELFEEYTQLMFDVLFHLESELDISKYDMQEARVFGYISEWLFGIYVTYLKSTGSFKIKELQRVFIEPQQKYPERDSIPIFSLADVNYGIHLGVAISSIVKNSHCPSRLYFYIMDGGIKEEDKIKLRNITDGRIEFIRMDDTVFANCPLSPDAHFTKHTYYRYLIPILKPYLNRAIYLDCDLVVTKPIEDLWCFDLSDSIVAACEDTWKYPALDWKYELGLTSDEFYFNAGVLLLNLEKMRSLNITEQLFRKTSEMFSKIKYLDQDILNIVLAGQKTLLPLKWNLQQTAFFETGSTRYSIEEIEIARANPAIIHFSGGIKPWQSGCLNPLWQEYFNYLDKSPWSNKLYKKQILKAAQIYHLSKRKLKAKIKKILRKN
ncbi:MAG: DUF4422 domain-containing protein [Proteobacteria bacterium]|nr:MAG: DUF4422 domain-containing protein [Pseudomonadota bacterium]